MQCNFQRSPSLISWGNLLLPIQKTAITVPPEANPTSAPQCLTIASSLPWQVSGQMMRLSCPLYLCKLSFHMNDCFMKKCLMKEIHRPCPSDESAILTEGMKSNKVIIHLKPTAHNAVQSSLANLYLECSFHRNFNDTT